MSDSESTSIERLLEENPGIDPGSFREDQAALKEMREQGLPTPSYNIDPPHQRRVSVERTEDAP